MLFGCYRRGEANDPEMYVSAIAAVLSGYDANLIREVTDPRTGIMTTEKYMSFMPNAGELKVYCEGIAAKRAHIKRLGELPRQDYARLPAPPPVDGDLATLFVSDMSPKYQMLLEWAETADKRLFKFDEQNHGIWISLGVWETGAFALRKSKPPAAQGAA